MHDGEVEHGYGEEEGVLEASIGRHDADQPEKDDCRDGRGNEERAAMTGVEEVAFAEVVIQR